MHVQVWLPGGVLVHVALMSQVPLVRHSSTSAQVTPLPVKPVLQVQVRPPVVLRQSASGEQPPLPERHSLMSWQLAPVPVYPTLQAQAGMPEELAHVALLSHTVGGLPHNTAEDDDAEALCALEVPLVAVPVEVDPPPPAEDAEDAEDVTVVEVPPGTLVPAWEAAREVEDAPVLVADPDPPEVPAVDVAGREEDGVVPDEVPTAPDDEPGWSFTLTHAPLTQALGASQSWSVVQRAAGRMAHAASHASTRPARNRGTRRIRPRDCHRGRQSAAAK